MRNAIDSVIGRGSVARSRKLVIMWIAERKTRKQQNTGWGGSGSQKEFEHRTLDLLETPADSKSNRNTS